VIRALLAELKSLDPETIAVLVKSYELVCADLQINPEQRPLAAETVALLIVEMVREGDCDGESLVWRSLQALRPPRQI
jgi:hypothetical protein